MKKLNAKDFVIISLLLGCLIFGYMSFFKGDDLYKYKVEELNKQNEALLKEKSLSDEKIKKLNLEFDSLKIIEIKLINDINLRDVEIGKTKDRANKSKKELDKFRREMEETRKKIDSLKANPANRTGEDLINSLKLKTQK